MEVLGATVGSFGTVLVAVRELWVLFWECKTAEHQARTQHFGQQFQKPSQQQKEGIPNTVYKFGGCKFGTQSKDGSANTQGIY